MKTKEELNALKNEVEALNKKLAELSEEELAQVAAGEYEQEIVAALWHYINGLLDDLRMAVYKGCTQYADQMRPIYEAYNRRSAADVKSAANAFEACIERSGATLEARSKCSMFCSNIAHTAEQIMTY